jgi:hypothetical protein
MSIPKTNDDQPIKRRALTRRERRALEQFAHLEISLKELQRCLGQMLEVNFAPEERRLTSHFLFTQPGVLIERKDIQAAMDRHVRGEMSTEQLADWATMLLLNDAYDWQGPEEEQIADWLNEISMLTLKAKSESE